jgi:23S rRNA (adenine2030-N6)-methyltransferase
MKKKASPFVYVDTHAGAGSYPLDSRESSQLGEFKQGIGRLFSLDEEELEHPLSTLIDMTKGDGSSSSIYPGSPMIAKTLSRSQDTHLLFEKARDQFDLLNTNIEHMDGEILNEDGYKGLAYYAEGKKGLPRALVFLDPPYQYGSDTDQICQMVKHLSWHWKSARVALWYPASDNLKEKSNRLLSMMRDSSDADMLALEMYGNDAVGTGIVLVNPPYGIEEELRSKLPRIAKLLREEKPTMRMKWL